MPYYSFNANNVNTTMLDLIGDVNRFKINFNVEGYTGENSIVDVLCKYKNILRMPSS